MSKQPRKQSPLHFTALPQHLAAPQSAQITYKSARVNVVGYKVNPVADFMFVGPSFINCDNTEDITVADLNFKVVEDDMEPESGWMPNVDTVNILDEVGNNTEQLVYINEAWAAGWSEELGETVKPGWYEMGAAGDGDFSDPRGTTPLAFGQALQISVYSGHADAALNFAGQVKAEPTITDLTGFMAIANCTPVDTTVAKMVFNAIEDDMEPTTGWMPNVDTINILDEVGNNTEQLVYINEAWAAGWSEELGETVNPGWYEMGAAGDGDFSDPRGTTPVLSGEGVQVSVYSGNPDVTVQVNSPIQK